MVQETKADFYNPDTFENGPPWDVFKELRENDPVYWNAQPPEEGTGFWVVSRYDDIVEVSSDYKHYLSGHGVFVDDSVGGSELMMVNMDEPKHTGLRNLIESAVPNVNLVSVPSPRAFLRGNKPELDAVIGANLALRQGNPQPCFAARFKLSDGRQYPVGLV